MQLTSIEQSSTPLHLWIIPVKFGIMESDKSKDNTMASMEHEKAVTSGSVPLKVAPSAASEANTISDNLAPKPAAVSSYKKLSRGFQHGIEDIEEKRIAMGGQTTTSSQPGAASVPGAANVQPDMAAAKSKKGLRQRPEKAILPGSGTTDSQEAGGQACVSKPGATSMPGCASQDTDSAAGAKKGKGLRRGPEKSKARQNGAIVAHELGSHSLTDDGEEQNFNAADSPNPSRGLRQGREDWHEKRMATGNADGNRPPRPGAVMEGSLNLAPGVPQGRGLRNRHKKKSDISSTGHQSEHQPNISVDFIGVEEAKIEEDVMIQPQPLQKVQEEAEAATNPISQGGHDIEGGASTEGAHPVGLPSTTNLAVATLVMDEHMHEDLATAQEVDVQIDEERQAKKKQGLRTKAFLVITLLVLVAIVVMVTVMATRKRNHDGVVPASPVPLDPTPSPTQSPTSVSSSIFSLLPPYSQESISEDTLSPQSRAFNWMINDPYVTSYPEWRLLQRFALATLYYATAGENWFNDTNWLSYNRSECDWYTVDQGGSYCLGGIDGAQVQLSLCTSQGRYSFLYDDDYYDDKYDVGFDDGFDVGYYAKFRADSQTIGRVQDLSLSSNGLMGTLPPEIGLLKEMRLLALGNNKLEGAIPTSIGLLTRLNELALNANGLEVITGDLGLLHDLVELNLGNNQIKGKIPTTMSNLTNLRHMYLEDNQFSGPLPTELGQHSVSLDKLYLFRNKLNIDFIPTEMGLMTLRELLLADQGYLPSTIPSEFGLLQTLTSLDILGRYGIDYSGGHGEGSYEFVYDLDRHVWIGTIPTELGLMKSLRSLFLQDNRLSGAIPSQLGSMWELWNFDLSSNNLHGPLPSELAGLNAKYLSLSGNELTGSLPTQIAEMVGLEILDLSHNKLSGVIPSQLGNMVRQPVPPVSGIGGCSAAYRRGLQPTLDGFCLYGMACPGLKSLILHSNVLTGQIPSELGRLRLSILDLSSNELTGKIPENLAENTNGLTETDDDWFYLYGAMWAINTLWKFNVANNGLTGTVPKDFGNLASDGVLSSFNASANDLLGIVPSGLCSLNSSLSFDCHPWMCGCSCSCHVKNTFAPTKDPTQSPSMWPTKSSTPTQSSVPTTSPSAVPSAEPTVVTTRYIQFQMGYGFGNKAEIRQPTAEEIVKLVDDLQWFLGAQLTGLEGVPWGGFSILDSATSFDYMDKEHPVILELDASVLFDVDESQTAAVAEIFDFMANCDYDNYLEWHVRKMLSSPLFSNATRTYFEPLR